jgi:hypothetical protein
MKTLPLHVALAVSVLTISTVALADDKVSFATGGYATMRSAEMMDKIDANGDNKVSDAEWDAYQKKLFVMMDLDNSRALNRKEFMRAHKEEVVTFATGGFANTFRTTDMFTKLDTNRDGQVSETEFVTWYAQMFDMMDTVKDRNLRRDEFIGRGPAN